MEEVGGEREAYGSGKFSIPGTSLDKLQLALSLNIDCTCPQCPVSTHGEIVLNLLK